MLPFMCSTYAAKHINKSFEPGISKKVKNLCRKFNEFLELCLMLVFQNRKFFCVGQNVLLKLINIQKWFVWILPSTNRFKKNSIQIDSLKTL